MRKQTLCIILGWILLASFCLADKKLSRRLQEKDNKEAQSADDVKQDETPEKQEAEKTSQKPEEKKEDSVNASLDMARLIEIPINCLYMILGLPMCFLGYRYLKVSVIVVGTIGGNLFF